MQATLYASNKELRGLHSSLANRVAKAIDCGSPYCGFETMDGVGTLLTYALRCHGTKYDRTAIDDRGQQLFVTPIATGRGWGALLGVSTVWRKVNADRLRFDTVQIISFLEQSEVGFRGNNDPIQFMRLEWEALDRNDNLSGSNAHPHWQIDIGKYALRDTIVPPTLAVSADIPTGKSAEGLPWVSKLHLAACGRWMDQEWSGDTFPAPHVSAPESLDQLGNWIVSACRYVHHQTNGAMGE